MFIGTEQSIRFCCDLRVDHSLGKYFLQNDVQFWVSSFFDRGRFLLQIFSDNSSPWPTYFQEMLLKCWRSVESALYHKMRTPKLHVILKKIITKRMIYTQTATKSNSLYSSYEHLKIPPPIVHSSILPSYPIPMLSILGLKFKFMSKL